MSSSQILQSFSCIKELFNYFSLQSIYKNNEKFKESYILNKVKTSLKEKLCKIWLDDMQDAFKFLSSVIINQDNFCSLFNETKLWQSLN
jgi:hypothetical protein